MSSDRGYGTWGIAYVVAAAAAVVAVALLPVAGSPSGYTYLTASVVAAAVAWRAPRMASGRRSPIAIGLVVYLAGDLTFAALYLTGRSTVGTTPADGFWLVGYLIVALGFLHLLRGHRSGRREDLDGLIDLAVVAVLVWFLAWAFVVSPTLADDSVSGSALSLVERLPQSLYPAISGATLALVVRAWTERRWLGRRALIVAVGVTAWLASDLGFLLLGPEVGDNAVTRAGWLLGTLLLAAALWQPDVPARDDQGEAAGIGVGRVVLALLPLLVPPVVIMGRFITGHGFDPVPGLVALILLVVLAFTRAVRLVRDAEVARGLVRREVRRQAALAANASDAVVVVDAHGRLLSDAPAFAALVGRAGESTVGAAMQDLAEPVHHADYESIVAQTQRHPGEVVEHELEVTIEGGRRRWLSVRLRDLRHDPDIGGIVCNLHDITLRKHAEAQLVHETLHDGLTGLANRELFHDRLGHALERTARTGTDPAVIFLDLDGFKDVNDTLGHGAGDRLLQEVARRLTTAVRTVDTVARLGGDEFAVLVEASTRPAAEAAVVAERIFQALSEPVDLPERPVMVSASIGVAVADPLATANSLLRDADIAMYHAKGTGRGCTVVFETDMLHAAVQRIAIVSELASALSEHQFHLVYQPVVALDSEAIVGFEALLRWEHPTLGSVPPGTFIPIAEAAGLIEPIGRWVLEEACRTAVAWRDAHPMHPPWTMAVNVSGRQLASPQLVAQVIDVLRRTGLEPSWLVLEMTETALVDDPVAAGRTLHALRELGIRLAIDDFGTGYCSLTYLRQFPVDILKIDRSFVDTITEEDHLPPIVRGLLDLARSLDLRIVAEGVERPVQRDGLRTERCEHAQGYLFSRPLDEAAAEALLATTDHVDDRTVPTSPDRPLT